MLFLVECGCNLNGSNGDATCNTVGQCNCIASVTKGLKCDECEDGTYGSNGICPRKYIHVIYRVS